MRFRIIDATIARHIFGKDITWKNSKHHAYLEPYVGKTTKCVPIYSSSYNAIANNLIPKMRALGYTLLCPIDKQILYHAVFQDSAGRSFEAHDSSLPYSICLAALKVFEHGEWNA